MHYLYQGFYIESALIKMLNLLAHKDTPTVTKLWDKAYKDLSQYEKKNTLPDLVKILFLDQYFQVDIKNYNILNSIRQIIINLQESNFWLSKFNCIANLTTCFEKRKISYTYLKNLNKDLENYLKEIYKKRDYMDPSKLLLTNEYSFQIIHLFLLEYHIESPIRKSFFFHSFYFVHTNKMNCEIQFLIQFN